MLRVDQWSENRLFLIKIGQFLFRMDHYPSILLGIGHLAISAILPVAMRNSPISLLRQIFDAIFVIFSHFESMRSLLKIFRSDYLIFTHRI